MKKLIYLLWIIIGLQQVINAQKPFKKIIGGKDVVVTAEDLRIEKSSQRVYNEVENVFIPKSIGKLDLNNDKGIQPVFLSKKITLASRSQMSTNEVAKAYMDELISILEMNATIEDFKVINESSDDLGYNHIKLQQNYQGIPIHGCELIIHEKGGTMSSINGYHHRDPKLSNISPLYTKDEVIEFCRKDIGALKNYKFGKRIFENCVDKANLEIYFDNESSVLTYHVVVFKNIAESWEYFVNAHTKEIIRKSPNFCKLHNHKVQVQNDKIENEQPFDGKTTANALDLFDISRSIHTYNVGSQFYLIDGSRDIFASNPSQLPDDPNGVIWTINAFNTSPQKDNFRYDHITSNNNSWNNKTAVSAHYNGGKAFEYFRNVHNRKSINGLGGNIISLINVTDEDELSMGNAFWNGVAMFYGNGDSAFLPLARGLDVAGHEMSHGVIQSTANLEYESESGALNESFADIFGAMIDREDWLIGEDVVKTSAFPSGALRSLQDPHNGAPTNNFNRGWQPKHFNERYQGNEDNGGVHINSGITNHAFFLLATAIGKDKAEKIFYRALSVYLTKSSKFVDCRIAVIQSAQDLYSQTEVNAAKKAFDDVGILGNSGGDYEVDIQTNPGQQFILATSASGNGLFLYTPDRALIGTISNTGVASKPSITDDGSEIVFVGKDKKIHYITINWSQNPITPVENIIGQSPIWRNCIISKDGFKIAGVTDDLVNEIIVFDFSTNPSTSNTFTLYNPTFSDGVTTGDVNYSDAMEFDHSGEYIMYDSENEISSNTTGSITYWDISFIKVWNNKSQTYSLGNIEKLYSSLPQNVSVGNPTFSKNSPYIIAFDYIDESENYYVVGANIERGETGLIFENNTLGYPTYSSQDDKVLFNFDGSLTTQVGQVKLDGNKIQFNGEDATLFKDDRQWAVWFSNGQRQLSDVEDVKDDANLYNLFPNPSMDYITITNIGNKNKKTISILIRDVTGKILFSQNINEVLTERKLDISNLLNGMYIIDIAEEKEVYNLKFVKM